MKKLICLLVIILICFNSFGQAIINRAGIGNTVADQRLQATLNFFAPRYADTTAALSGTNEGIDSCGAIIFTYDVMAVWFRSCYGGSKKWVMLDPSGIPSTGNSWRLYGNAGLFTGASGDVPFGITVPNYGIDFTTNNTSRFILDRTGILPNTATTLGIGVDPSNSNKLSFFSAASSAWSLTGNAGTTAGTNFIGTTDGIGLMFKTNNVQSGYLDIVENNTSFGVGSMISRTNGSFNTAMGRFSLTALTTGINNTGVGESALGSNTTGTVNTAIGSQALELNTTGAENTGVGSLALNAITGNNNIGIGTHAGKNAGALSNQLFISSIAHSTIAQDSTRSIIYGVQDATAADQRLYANSQFFTPYITNNTSQDRVVGMISGTGQQGFLTLGAGVSIDAGVLNATGTGGWLTTGNSGTTAGTNFWGTTDNIDAVGKANNKERLRIGDSAWRIGNNLSYVKSNNVGNKLHLYTNQTSSDFTNFMPLAGQTSDGEVAYMTSWPFVEIADSATLANPTGYLMGKEAVGVFDATTFPGVSLPSGWTNYLISPTVNDGITFTGNGGGITDGFTYSTKYSSSLNYKTTVYFTLNTKPATYTDGFYVGRRSANTAQQTQNAIIARYSDANNWRLVTNILYAGAATIVDSTGTVPMANGNKYKIEVSGSNTNIYAKFTLLTTGGLDSVTAAVNYKYVPESATLLQPANIGSDWMSGLGSTGSYTVTSISTSHYEDKQTDVLFLGNSVGTRYDATSVMNHYTTLSMNGTNKSWANLAGGGDRLTDMNLERDAIVQIAPKYCIIEGGINDGAGDIRTQLNKLIDTLQANNIIPIFLKLFSVTAKDTVVFNVCVEQGVKLVDANRPNQVLPTTDGAHATDLGNQQIVYYLRSECPEIFGRTGGAELYTLNGMGDVLNTSLSNNDVLKWSSAQKRWINGTTTPVAGTDMQVQFNLSGALAGDPNLKFDYTGAGKLGIGLGVGTPQTSLDVAGTIQSNNVNHPSSGNWMQMFYYPAGGYGQIRAYNWTGGAYLPITIGNNEIYTDGTGKVGINDATPLEALDVTGNIQLSTAGNKLKIATGANASIGVSGAMTAGTITISTTAVTASSKIFLTHASLGGTQGILSVGTVTAGTSFVINSSNAADTGTVNWWIVN